jgi:hypoxanthine phosphoribosyltransferase
MDEAGFKPLYSSAEIANRLNVLASDIAGRMPRDFVLVAILKGSFVFAADLVRALVQVNTNPDVEFMILSSYGEGLKTSGNVKLLRDTEISVENRHVLLVDDILDSGRTLEFARAHVLARGAKTAKVCVLLEKAEGQGRQRCEADFVGFACPDAFVVGYGMDHAHKFRGLPHIAILCE